MIYASTDGVTEIYDDDEQEYGVDRQIARRSIVTEVPDCW
jgi:hypothetical protein